MSKPDNELLSDEELHKVLERHLRHYKYYHIDSPKGMTDGEAESWLFDLFKSQKQLHANMVIGEDDKLVIPDYPSKDDEGEPLYSKRAAKEGRKQVAARYHARRELRSEQRQRNSNHA